MHSYTVLGDVTTHQKRFTIFVTNDNKYVFLRHQNGKYFYPALEDYITLNRFATLRKDVYPSKTSDKVAAFLIAAVIGGGLISNFILYQSPQEDMTMDKDTSLHFEQIATVDPKKGEIDFTEISENPTMEELLEIYHNNVAAESIPEIETLIRTICAYDPNLNHYNFARNLAQMRVYLESQETLNERTNLYAAGLWYPYEKKMHLLPDYNSEAAYHEIMHSAESYVDDYETTGFTYPSDPEFENLGGFMVECGDEYFLNRLNLKKSNSTEMISMIAFASVMGEHEFIQTYYNKTVKDFALELNTVIGDMEETKNLIRLLDLYHNYCCNDALQNKEETVEMSMEMQADLFDRLFDYMAKGLRQNYEKNHDEQAVKSAMERMNLFLENETDEMGRFNKANIIWQAKCKMYLPEFIEPQNKITRNKDQIIYHKGKQQIDISDYAIDETTYINEYGDKIFGKVLQKETSEGPEYFSVSTLAKVNVQDPGYPSPLQYIFKKNEYTMSDMPQIWIVAMHREGIFWDIVQDLYPKNAIDLCSGNSEKIATFLKSLSFTPEEINHFDTIIKEDTITMEDVAIFLEHVYQKKLEETTTDLDSVYQYATLLSKYSYSNANGESLSHKYYEKLKEKCKGTELERFFYFYDLNKGTYYNKSITFDRENDEKVVNVKVETIENGTFQTKVTTYDPDRLTYAFSKRGDLILYHQEQPNINIFTETSYDVDTSKGEIPFMQTITNPLLQSETLEQEYTFFTLLHAGFLDGLFSERMCIYVQDGTVQVMTKVGDKERGFFKDQSACFIYITDQGAIIPAGSDQIQVGQTVNILTNRVIKEQPTIYETISFDEYCSRLGITLNEGMILPIENGTIQKSFTK